MKLESRDYVWIIGILTVAVIVQASLKVENDANLATLVGVATGIVSMVLGILAIFYSFTSSGTLNETSSRLHEASIDISKSVEAVTSELRDMSSKIVPLAQQVAEIHAKLPLVSQGNQSSTSSPPQPSGQNIDQFVTQLIDYFLATSSWLGLLTIYTAIERQRTNKPFNPYTWATMIGGISPDYAIGYLVCASSAGFITYDTHRFLQQGNVVITDVFPLLKDKISQNITANLNRPGLTPENATLRTQQKTQTDTYISQP